MTPKADVMLLPQKGYQHEDLLEKIDLILDHFSSHLPNQGAKVLLKPNLVKSAERSSAAQTDCEFMRALIVCGQKRNWDITVGDSPAIGSARQVGKASGLSKVCDDLQVPLVTLNGADSKRIDDRTTTIASDLKKFDSIINVPKLKGHGQLYYTGGVKNLYGCVGGKRKIYRHVAMGDKEGGRLFARMLLDVAQLVKPCLTIIDGIDTMAGRGPLHGQCVQENLIAASTDPIALDWHLVHHHLGGDIQQDPVLNLVFEESDYHHHQQSKALTPLGLPERGDFYFPEQNERKPISFHPWILIRFAFRNLKSKLVG
jgi:uncharacterized protein (DUF362 family)